VKTTGAIVRGMERKGNEENRAPMKVRGRRLQGVSGGLFRSRPREKGVHLSWSGWSSRSARSMENEKGAVAEVDR